MKCFLADRFMHLRRQMSVQAHHPRAARNGEVLSSYKKHTLPTCLSAAASRTMFHVCRMDMGRWACYGNLGVGVLSFLAWKTNSEYP